MARDNRRDYNRDSEYKEKVVNIARVTKVVKGGKKMGFRAVVVVGDMKTKVGLGIGKAAEVSAAIRKGVEAGKKGLIEVPLYSGTIPHDVIGKFSASTVVLRPAPRGTGVIAGGAVRTILELCGLKNIVAKSIGSANPINVARATLHALGSLKNLETLTLQRGKEPKVSYVET
ncbi:MAG: 30S ribosomal protein S5 [Candidatus Margulisbacteria bacterium]|nr:30S ribosomal protein S5 [Candidatus Margulisiibacteriota bacterium]